MSIYELTQIGTFHENHCEDYVLSCPLSDNRFLLAVLDGCSMGEESYFASALLGKILRKIAKDLYYLDTYLPTSYPVMLDQLRFILQQLFDELVFLQNRLYLEPSHLLTTLLIAVVDSTDHKAEVGIFGDGVVIANGQVWEFDQNNRPDYLAYHLIKGFDSWWVQQEQRLSLCDLKDLSLSTDGIFSFRNFEAQAYLDPAVAIQELLIVMDNSNNERTLVKQLKRLQDREKVLPGDDLGIIRAIL